MKYSAGDVILEGNIRHENYARFFIRNHRLTNKEVKFFKREDKDRVFITAKINMEIDYEKRRWR